MNAVKEVMNAVKEWLPVIPQVLGVIGFGVSMYTALRNRCLERVDLRFKFDDATEELLIDNEAGQLTANLRVRTTVTNEGKFPFSIDGFFFEYVPVQKNPFDRGGGSSNQEKVNCCPAKLLGHGASHSEILPVPEQPTEIKSVGVRDTTGRERKATNAELSKFLSTVDDLQRRLRAETENHFSE